MVDIVQAQFKKYGKDFDAMMSYLGIRVLKKDYNVQPLYISKTRSQPTRPKVAPFMGKVECEKCLKAACAQRSMCMLKNCENNNASSLHPSSIACP